MIADIFNHASQEPVVVRDLPELYQTAQIIAEDPAKIFMPRIGLN